MYWVSPTPASSVRDHTSGCSSPAGECPAHALHATTADGPPSFNIPFNCVNHPLKQRRYAEDKRYGNQESGPAVHCEREVSRPRRLALTQANSGESPHALQLSPGCAGGDVSRPQRAAPGASARLCDPRLAQLLTLRTITLMESNASRPEGGPR